MQEESSRCGVADHLTPGSLSSASHMVLAFLSRNAWISEENSSSGFLAPWKAARSATARRAVAGVEIDFMAGLGRKREWRFPWRCVNWNVEASSPSYCHRGSGEDVSE